MKRIGRKFETYTHEDGREFVIRYDKSDRVFYVVIQKDKKYPNYRDKRIEGKDPTQVLADLKAWLQEQDLLTWEPVIIVGGVDFWGDDASVDYERVFRAKLRSGKWIHKVWRVNLKKVKKDGTTWDKVSQLVEYGEPGNLAETPDDGAKLLKYTPGRWLTLKKLSDMIRAMKERLDEFFEQDEVKLTKKIDALARRRGNLLTMLPEAKEG
jgi:hypothetical protein